MEENELQQVLDNISHNKKVYNLLFIAYMAKILIVKNINK